MVSRQTDKDTKTTRVYKYGLLPVDKVPEEAINELWRANKLWNKLVELHNKRFMDYEKARCEAHLLYGEVAERYWAKQEEVDQAYDEKRTARMEAGTRDGKHPLVKAANARISALKAQRDVIYKELKPIRAEADAVMKKSGVTKDLNAKFNSDKNDACKVGECGLYGYTANAVRQNFENASKAIWKKPNSNLQFHRFDGTGYFHYRFRSPNCTAFGITVDEFFKSKDARFGFTGVGSKRGVYREGLRVLLAGGAKKATHVSQDFMLVGHRKIPDDGIIPEAKIVRSRNGDRFKYDLVVTVKRPAMEVVKHPSDVAIGIDIGFRRSGDSVKVAVVAFSDGSQPPEVIKLPSKVVKRMDYAEKLQSDLDKSATELGKLLKPMLTANHIDKNHAKYKLWCAAAKYPNNCTLSFETAYRLAGYVNHNPEFVSAEASNLLALWRVKWGRRYQEFHSVGKKARGHRKDFYRQVASRLVANGVPIAVEKINLSKAFVEVKDKDNTLSDTARAQRTLVSLHEFLGAIKNAAKREGVPYFEMPPKNTSRKCRPCGEVNKKLRSEEVWICPKCATKHDRDVNAAYNIADLGLDKLKKL